MQFAFFTFLAHMGLLGGTDSVEEGSERFGTYRRQWINELVPFMVTRLPIRLRGGVKGSLTTATEEGGWCGQLRLDFLERHEGVGSSSTINVVGMDPWFGTDILALERLGANHCGARWDDHVRSIFSSTLQQGCEATSF